MSYMEPYEQEAYDEATALIAQAEYEGWTELHLSFQVLSELPPEISRLTGLCVLDLSSNQLTDIPNTLRKLTQLQTLNLGGNELTAVPDALRELTQLQNLDLGINRLTAIPDWLHELTQLQALNLSFNPLTVVPDTLCELIQLQTLHLSQIGLTIVPKWLSDLSQLQTLSLAMNKLTAIPDTLRDLIQLQSLDLAGNELTTIPDWLAEMPELKKLYIAENPITQPPPEQLGKTLTEMFHPVDLDALRRYFAQLRREGEAYFYEAKLLIVGEGGAGKTSLVRKLQNSAAALPPLEDSTDGIDIETWSFPLDAQDLSSWTNLTNLPDQYHVNIWDFGGQSVYHATHQFFLTKRSVYVLVADTRRQHTDFYDWLKMQELFGADSPIILLKNRNRKEGIDFVIENLLQLRSRFPNLLENTFEIDLSNVPDEADWIDLLRYLQKQFLALDHIGVARPKTWVEVRKTLDADPRDTISREEYLALCAQQGIPDPEDALQLSDYLHHLGDILHFQDDPILTDLTILNPTWGLDAVYRVLDNREIKDNNGQFTLAQLRDLWHEARYHNHRDKLLRLMQKFKLCYPLRGVDDTYIAPQLLNTETPDYKPVNGKDDLQLRYKYPYFMPRGILSRAIVALHHRITDQQKVWRTGVILQDQYEYARAELLEQRGEKEIHIRVSGGNKRDLLMEIVRALDDLHRAFPKLQYKKLVPCRCDHCLQPENEPHFFNLELLNKYRNKNIPQIRCDKSLEEVHVHDLVDDGILESETRHGDINIYGDVTGGDSITMGDITNSKGVAVGDGSSVKSS